MVNHMMRGKKVLTLFGFPIYVQLFFLILIALFVFPSFGNSVPEHVVALSWAPILFISIVVHELGHAFAIKKLGYGNSKILLWGMGGVCINRRRNTPKHGLIISLAGPIFGFILGIPFLLAFIFMPEFPDPTAGEIILAGIVWNMVFVNIGWSILNLLPIFPLDGGKVLMYILRILGVGEDKATKNTGLIGLILLVPIALLGLWWVDIWMLVIVFFLGQSAWQAFRHGAVAMRST